MNIGFDVSVQEERPAGVARLQRSLLEGLSRVDADHRYFLYSPREVDLPVELDERFESVVTGGPTVPRRWRSRVLPPALRTQGIQIFHSPVVAIPFAGPGKRIATAHDIPWLHPQTATEGGALRKMFSLGRTLRRASRVLVPSEFTRNDLVKLRPRFASKVEVVRPGLQRKFLGEAASLQRTVEVCESRQLPKPPYLLAVGTVRSRKNLQLLFQVLARISELADRAESLPPLIVVGASEDRPEQLAQWVREFGTDSEVFFTGYVPEEDLIPLYDGAACLLFPTLLEGFGFPPLEGFARRVPVVASPSGAVPEVLGPDSALLVPPGDVNGWVTALLRVLSEKELRDRLVRNGLKRARAYDPEDAAVRVLSLYDRVGCEL